MAKGRKTGGRKVGTPNKTTKNAREAFQAAFDALNKTQDEPQSLGVWAAANPTEFYKLYARLIPVEHVGDPDKPLATVVKHIYEASADPRS